MNPSGPLNRANPRRLAAASPSRQVTDSDKETVVSSRAARAAGDGGSVAVLLDLSGDNKASQKWADSSLPQTKITRIEKAELKWSSRREALTRVRALKPDVFALFTNDLTLQSGLGALMIFAVCAGACEVAIGDKRGGNVLHSRLRVLLVGAPRFFVELFAGYGFIVPVSWLLTEFLRISLSFRAVVRASRTWTPVSTGGCLSALYIRATLANAAEGGMPTHVEGFAKGAAKLGHRLRFIESGTASNSRDLSIEPSLLVSATRVLFELWNNLAFTGETLRLIPADAAQKDIDFIYQRYSRFNWTGAALSLITGIPLALEYNGSEVWVGRQWDPIGQLWLLKRFERLNLIAADLIFVVSDVERHNLIAAGIEPAKIVVNVNGVDTDCFYPGCGGSTIRRRFGIDDKIVVGFVGTFGPWHGAPLLAEAARLVTPAAGCHFLFIGDGDQRAQTESIMKSSPASSTFAGRIPHDDVPAYLDACDILVSPHVPPADGSEFFGSPTKLFEYMAMGKGLAASRLGQIGEVIIHGETGLLVEPGNADELARAIERLAVDEVLRRRLGAAARRTAIERYTWRDNAARVFDAVRLLKRGAGDW